MEPSWAISLSDLLGIPGETWARCWIFGYSWQPHVWSQIGFTSFYFLTPNQCCIFIVGYHRLKKSNDSSYSRILANPAPKNQPFFPRKKLVVNPCESESIYSLRSHRFVAPRVVSQSAISLQIKVTTRIITPNLPNIHLCLQVLKWCMQIFRESHNKGIFHAYWGLHFWELYSIN